MIDRRNRTRRILNAVAHRVLQAEGEVGRSGLVTTDGREFCVGDEVVARRPARELHPTGDKRSYVRNGSRGRVLAIGSGADGAPALTVEFESLGTIMLPGSFVEAHPDPRGRVRPGLDYGYTLTSYAVQGATLPASSTAVTAGARRRELYVNLTRGRQDNHLFVAAPADSLAGEGHLPRPPEDDVVAEVLAAVGRPDEDRSALEIDPLALAVAEARNGRTPAQLRSLGDAIHMEDKRGAAVLARAEAVALAAAGRAAVAEPPAWAPTLLPDRPSVPWMAAHWDDAVASIATYRARWEPTPVLGASRPPARVLGSPANEAQAADRAAALDRIGDVWAAVAGRLVADHARSALDLAPEVRAALLCPPPWLRQHLEELGQNGRFADGVPVNELAALYGDVVTFRERWVRSREPGPERGMAALLGDRPDEPLGRRQWDMLARRVDAVAQRAAPGRSRAR